jgi:hypothetical protein
VVNVVRYLQRRIFRIAPNTIHHQGWISKSSWKHWNRACIRTYQWFMFVLLICLLCCQCITRIVKYYSNNYRREKKGSYFLVSLIHSTCFVLRSLLELTMKISIWNSWIFPHESKLIFKFHFMRYFRPHSLWCVNSRSQWRAPMWTSYMTEALNELQNRVDMRTYVSKIDSVSFLTHINWFPIDNSEMFTFSISVN